MRSQRRLAKSPAMAAASPPGTLPGKEILAIQLTMMMASETKGWVC